MIKIYEIPHEKFQALKNLVEAKEEASEELSFELETNEGEKTSKKEKAKKWKINEVKRQSYTLRDAKSLGINKNCSYLIIDGTEDFFKKNEKSLLELGVKEVKGKEAEDIRKKTEKSDEEVSSGVGLIFK